MFEIERILVHVLCLLKQVRHCGSLDGSQVDSNFPLIQLNRIMSIRQINFQEDTNFRVMRLIQDNPNLTQRELAQELGVSLGGLNYCLRALMDKGLIKMQNFNNSSNKLKYAYILTPKGIKEKSSLTYHFLERKMREYSELKAEIDALKSEVERVKGKS